MPTEEYTPVLTPDEKKRGRRRQYYLANREKELAQAAAWRAENPAKLRECTARWRTANQEKRQAYWRQYYAANQDRLRERERQRSAAKRAKRRAQTPPRQKDPERLRANKKRYRDSHKPQLREAQRQWRAAHPEKARAATQRRLAVKSQAPINDFTVQQWKILQQAYAYRCVYCPPTCWRCQRRRHALTMDHIQPLSKGGAHTYTNIVPSCQSCNSRKGNRPVLVPVQPVLFLT